MSTRIALAGAGRFGMQLGRLLLEMPRVEVAGIYSHTPASAAAAGQTLGLPAYSSYAELLSIRPLDAVVVATSHGSHSRLVIEAARSGKHVFCEKPMAITVAECRDMIRATESAGVRLLVGHSMRYHPLVRRAASLLEDGQLGLPVAVTMLRFASQVRLGWWSRRSEYGGMLHSPGIHELDLMNTFLGRAQVVYAQAGPRIQRQTDYDDTMIVQVGYESGAIGVLATSLSDPLSDPGGKELTRVLCQNGGFEIEFGAAPSFQVQRRGQAQERTADTADAWASIRAELENFVAWIAGEDQPVVLPEEALAAVELCEAAYLSASTGQPVGLPLGDHLTSDN